MRIAHFDCFSGISGDMTLAALISAGVSAEAIRAGLDSLGLPIRLEIEPTVRGAFAALEVRVHGEDDQPHRYLRDVEAIIDRGKLTDRQRDLARRIFHRLAAAEAAVHGMDIQQVHFHEVGALDSIADIVGAAIGLDLLGVERFTSRAVPTGIGTVKAAHGVMPIPTPGTAELLKGVPLAPSSVKAELTTPTGAAILTTIVEQWTDLPAMTIERIGYGAGRRDLLDQPNLLRLLVGTARAPAAIDSIWVIETNLDDTTPEIVGYGIERLLTAGAVDAYAMPITMKKGRPGVMLAALVPDAALSAVEDVLFRETGTFGLRRHRVERCKLHRRPHAVQTRWGLVQGKLGWRDDEAPIFTPEFEDCARIARAEQVPLRQVYAEVRRAYEREAGQGGPNASA